MKYDFTTLLNRKNVGAEKWLDMYRQRGDVDEDVVPMSIADMEFKNAPEIVEGLKAYLDQPIFGYTAPTDEYYEAVIGWMKKRNGWDIKREWIFTYAGVVPALFACVRAFTQPGEGVIIMPPVYPPFHRAAQSHDRELVYCPLINREGSYFIDFERLEEVAKKPENKLLIFCNPHNPVGRVWREAELRRLGEICNRNGVLVISDEIHSDLIMPGFKHIPYGMLGEEFAQNSILCTAPSKTFNLAGLQTSNLIIPNRKLTDTLCQVTLTGETGSMLNTFGYEACRLAYTEGEPWMEELIQVIDENRRFTEEYLSKHIPEAVVSPLEGTYLLWIDLRCLGMSPQELERTHVEKAQAFLDEGYIFGKEGEGFERVNLACPRKALEEVLERMVNSYSL